MEAIFFSRHEKEGSNIVWVLCREPGRCLECPILCCKGNAEVSHSKCEGVTSAKTDDVLMESDSGSECKPPVSPRIALWILVMLLLPPILTGVTNGLFSRTLFSLLFVTFIVQQNWTLVLSINENLFSSFVFIGSIRVMSTPGSGAGKRKALLS